VAGAALAAAGFALLAFGLVRVEQAALSGGALVLAGLAVLAAFVAVERRARAPMVRLAIFRHRPLTGANLSIAANAGGFVGMTFMATLYMQQVLRYSPIEAGLAFLPLALSGCAGGLLAPYIVALVGPRRTAAGSLLMTAAAFVFLARVPDRDGYASVLLPAFLCAGFSFASAFVLLTTQGMTGVREGEKGLASGLFQTSTHLGGAFVLTVLATAAAARTNAALDGGEPAAAALTSGFGLAFLVAAGIVALGALTAVRTLPGRA
jgi:Major Facilitator Superfamily